MWYEDDKKEPINLNDNQINYKHVENGFRLKQKVLLVKEFRNNI